MGTELFLCLWLMLRGAPAGEDTLSVLFWNVENFFDWRNDSTGVADAEFSSSGERRWTRKRFYAKCNALAKVVFWTADRTDRWPDFIALAEVENAFVLRRLLQDTPLRKRDYRYIHYDSPDRRGIDVALLYRSSVWTVVESRPCHLYEEGPDGSPSVMQTRDILLVHLRRLDSGAECAVLVNHHPSKYGGAAVSAFRRRRAVERLRDLADSLSASGVRPIIAGGDFNDTPSQPLFRLLGPALVPLHGDLYRRGEGTIKYNGKWELIDHFYVSPFLAPRARMQILRIPFLLVPDRAHAGEKPLRTYTGPRYTGGVSDHLPILLECPVPE